MEQEIHPNLLNSTQRQREVLEDPGGLRRPRPYSRVLIFINSQTCACITADEAVQERGGARRYNQTQSTRSSAAQREGIPAVGAFH